MVMLPNWVRLSYAQGLLEAKQYTNSKGIASGPFKYTVRIMIPKTDTKNIAFLHSEIEAAKVKGAKKFWGGVVPQDLKILGSVIPGIPLRDGDREQKELGGKCGPEAKGHYFFNVSSYHNPPSLYRLKPKHLRKPGECVVEPVDVSMFYSGCRVAVDIGISPNKENCIGGYLNQLVFVADDTRIDGREDITSAIAKFDIASVDAEAESNVGEDAAAAGDALTDQEDF